MICILEIQHSCSCLLRWPMLCGVCFSLNISTFYLSKKKKEEEEIAALEQWGKWISRIKSGWRKACCKLVFFYFINSIVKAMVFPVVMYGYESWTIKRAEH